MAIDKKFLMIASVLIIALVTFVVIKYWNAAWEDVRSPDHVEEFERASNNILYQQYISDMSMRPSVISLMPTVAKRGNDLSPLIINRIKDDPSSSEIRAAIFVFYEMERIGSYNICANEADLIVLRDAIAADDSPLSRSNRSSLEQLCP